MCTISYRKCACFVFLVVLVLSCSGSRIDNLEMTDVSRRNPPEAPEAHRLRHRRQMMATRRRLHCPEVDVSWKAYRADAVAVAKVESTSCKGKGNCTMQFKIHDWMKPRPPFDDKLIRLTFRGSVGAFCDNDDAERTTPYFPEPKSTDRSKKYFLFLRTDGPHTYRAAYAPEQLKSKTQKIVKRVIDRRFKPKPPRLEITLRNESRKRLRLICRVRGFPIPLITWKVNNTILQPNHRIRITQKKKKNSLVIRNFTEADRGWYQCVASSVEGKSSHANYTISSLRVTSRPKETTNRPMERPAINSAVPDKKPCKPEMQENYCYNGTCFYTESMDEYSCECHNGYEGQKCETKTSVQLSRYRQTPLSTCKVGLYTKFDNC